MNKNIKVYLLVTMFLFNFSWLESTIKEWKELDFYIPFKSVDRKSYESLHKQTISVFGAHRNSYVKGHKHAGIDLKGKLGEKVFAIARGRVVDIQFSFPNLSLIVKHEFKKSSPIYSRYTHVEDILVKIGDDVDHQTCLARLFNAEEKKRSRFMVNHLHLEIRKRIDDDSRASFTSLTMTQLKKFCIDPLKFFKKVLN